MYNIEIHESINKLVDLFRRLHMQDEDNGFRKTAWKLMYLIFNLPFIISLILGSLLSADWNESIFLSSVCVVVLVSTIKLSYILWKKEEIRSFLKDIGTHSVADYEEFKKFNDKVNDLMNFARTIFFSVLVCGTVLLIVSLPAFSNEKFLPLIIWFPLDWKKNAIIYWIAFAYVSFGVILNIIAASLNFIIWHLMMNCAIKYQILGNQFKNMFTIKKRKITEKEKENLFLQELIDLIKSHRNIQETIDRFKCCFEKLFFGQITTSGIGICGSVYALAFSDHDANLFQYIINIGLLSYHIFDIFMVMHFGNEIMLASDRLSYFLFESNWLERSKSCKMCITILMEVLKQPQELLIIKLYPLNMETFLSIVDLAYSMFNILKNLK